MGTGNSRTHSQRGASLVEFAILAPLLLLLIFGIIEMSRAMFAYTTVWSAAREGARYATTVEADHYIDCGGIEAAAVAKVVLTDIASTNIDVRFFDSSGNQIADCQGGVPPTVSNVPSGSIVEVAISNVSFDSVVPLVEVFLDGLSLNSTQRRTVFVQEQVGG